MIHRLLLCVSVCLLFPACGRQPAPTPGPGGPAAAQPEKGGAKRMNIEIKSAAFEEGGMIPKRYTGDGADVSPPLTWSDLPKSTESVALLCDDPDAPVGDWVHWILFNLPSDTRELKEAVPKDGTLPNGAVQGKNGWDEIGYRGPAPPGGTHRYFFKLYALDVKLDLPAGASKADLLKAIEGRVLAEGQLMGRYTRD